jgi:hypothetical protein
MQISGTKRYRVYRGKGRRAQGERKINTGQIAPSGKTVSCRDATLCRNTCPNLAMPEIRRHRGAEKYKYQCLPVSVLKKK